MIVVYVIAGIVGLLVGCVAGYLLFGRLGLCEDDDADHFHNGIFNPSKDRDYEPDDDCDL